MPTRRRIGLAVSAVTVACAGLAACGGGGSGSVSIGSSTTVAASAQVFQSVDAKIRTAINAAEPKLGAIGRSGSQQAGEFTDTAQAIMSASQTWLNDPGRPDSDNVDLLDSAMQALVTDFSKQMVDVSQTSDDIGQYESAATEFEQAAHIPG